MKTTQPYAAYVGLDWADRSHEICLRVAGSDCVEHSQLPQTPASLHDWARALRIRFPHGKIAIAVEQSKGPLIYALSGYEHLVIFVVNPATLAKYRLAAKPSGTKNDRLDATLICEILTLHPDWLRQLPVIEAKTRELQMMLEWRRGLIEERTSLSNQLTAALKAYYPQALHIVGESVCSPMACDFLKRWPTLESVKRARRASLIEFYHSHGVHSEERIQERLDLIRTAVALTSDKAVLAAYPRLVSALIAQVEVLGNSIDSFDTEIAENFARHEDKALFCSFPGAGEQLAPRLFVAFGPDRSRYDNAQQLQQYSGIAPVKKTSGENLHKTLWRWHCPTFLRQSFQEYAGCSIPKSKWAFAYYKLHIRNGSRQYVLRSLAYKWQRIMFRCWINHEPYDEERYLASLRETHSPLIDFIDNYYGKAA